MTDQPGRSGMTKAIHTVDEIEAKLKALRAKLAKGEQATSEELKELESKMSELLRRAPRASWE